MKKQSSQISVDRNWRHKTDWQKDKKRDREKQKNFENLINIKIEESVDVRNKGNVNKEIKLAGKQTYWNNTKCNILRTKERD